LVLYFAAIIAIIGAILVSSFIIGERRKNRSPLVYESGMNPTALPICACR
jgi:NADH:ubiquinone oxidoreductase subunit 3 (subunit A)